MASGSTTERAIVVGAGLAWWSMPDGPQSGHDSITNLGGVILSASAASMPDGRFAAARAEDLVERLRQRLVADPLRRWTLSDLAAKAGASPRTRS